jgi:hypothetical protein
MIPLMSTLMTPLDCAPHQGAKPVLDNSPELKELETLTGLDEVKAKVRELMHLQLDCTP